MTSVAVPVNVWTPGTASDGDVGERRVARDRDGDPASWGELRRVDGNVEARCAGEPSTCQVRHRGLLCSCDRRLGRAAQARRSRGFLRC